MAPAYVAILYTCGFVYFSCEAINLLVIIPHALLTAVVLTTLIHRVKDHWYPEGCDEKYEYSSFVRNTFGRAWIQPDLGMRLWTVLKEGGCSP